MNAVEYRDHGFVNTALVLSLTLGNGKSKGDADEVVLPLHAFRVIVICLEKCGKVRLGSFGECVPTRELAIFGEPVLLH